MKKLVKESLNETNSDKYLDIIDVIDIFSDKSLDKKIRELEDELYRLKLRKENSQYELKDIESMLDDLGLEYYWEKPAGSYDSNISVRVDVRDLDTKKKDEIYKELNDIVKFIQDETTLNVSQSDPSYPPVFIGDDYFKFWIS